MNFKKILLVGAFVILTIGMGYLLYRFFFAAPAAPPVTPPTTVPPTTGLPPSRPGGPPTGGPEIGPGGLPTAGPSAIASGGLTQTERVTASPVLSPTVGPDGSLTYYDQVDGRIYRLDSDGVLRTLTDATFLAARKVTFSPDADKAVIEFPDDSKVIYDFEKQKQTTIPKHWTDLGFSGDGDSIAAKSMGFDPENRWLIVARADGTGAKLVEPLGNNADKVIINVSPDAEVIAFSDTADPVGFDTKEYHVIGQNGENFKTLRVEGFGFMPKWTPGGEQLLYSSSTQGNDYQPSLSLVNAKGQGIGTGRTDLGLRTWADKCTFNGSTTMFCAVPDFLPTGAGLQREVASGVPDTIYKVDLVSGSTTIIGRPATDATMTSLMVTPDGGELLFTDEQTGAIQRMRLR